MTSHRWLLVVSGVVIAAVLWRLLIFVHLVSVSKSIVRDTKAFNLDGGTSTTLLVLGDSTAAGVGADTPADSVAASLAGAVGATRVENRAVSGAQVHDLASQIAVASERQYDYILVMIGGNDIIRFHGASTTAAVLKETLMRLPHSRQTILVTAANVGDATLFPLPLRAWYTHLNLEYHARFAAVAAALGITFVDLSVPKGEDPFIRDPEKYLSSDGLHPSSEGYRFWWGRIAPHVLH